MGLSLKVATIRMLNIRKFKTNSNNNFKRFERLLGHKTKSCSLS